jgi:1-acyl-sn-glycerol-3-phosphate acyltransferase
MVLIFPEGTRSVDGQVAPLKPGFVALARRGRQPLVPVALDGAFEAWPRHACLPRPVPIHVCIGRPLEVATIRSMTDQQVVEELELRIRALHRDARRGRLRLRR